MNDISINENKKSSRLQECINEYFDSLFSDLNTKSFEDLESNKSVNLSSEEQERICEKLLLLPDDARYLMFGEYCFNMAFDDIGDMFDITEPKGLSIWYKRMLSNMAGLDSDKEISDESLRLVSRNALEKYIEKIEAEANKGKIIKVSSRTRHYMQAFAKVIAAAVVIFAIGFTTTFTVNAEFREQVVNWFVETFQEFSIFNTSTDNETSLEELKLYEPGYMPDGYSYVDRMEMEDGVNFIYANEEGSIANILITMPSDNWMVNTEEMEFEKLDHNGTEAFFYNGEEGANFIFSKEGYPMYIMGITKIEECIQIADGIKKEK